jgi:ABC-2 type transport system ATP-binding protein
MSAIEILGLQKNYSVGFWRQRPKTALRPLTFSIEEGEVFALLGQEGVGKTTILKLLVGLISPTAGTAKILGMEIDDPRVRAQIGFLPEQPRFYDHLTGQELLTYYAHLSGIPATERARRVDEILSRVGLASTAATRISKYSRTMLQRLGLAQAILHNPKVLLLDEPMSGLDPVERREVRQLIREFQQEGKTVFFSTHTLADVEGVCDRVALINQGEFLDIRTPAEFAHRAGRKVEIVFCAAAVPEALASIGGETRTSGQITSTVIEEAQQEFALEILRKSNARLFSLTPVRTSLMPNLLEGDGHNSQLKVSGKGAGA